MSLLQKASIITTPTAYAEDYLYSIKPALSFGSNLLTASWTTSGDWTFTNNGTPNATLNKSTTSTTDCRQSSIGLVLGRKYRLEFTISTYTSGNLTVKFGGGSTTQIDNEAVGRFSLDLIKDGGLDNFQFGNTFQGTIEQISLREITDADFDFDRNSTGTRVNEDYLIEDVPYNFVTYSEEIENKTSATSGGGSSLTATNNYGVAPNGTLTAGRLQCTAGSNYALKGSIITPTTDGQKFTMSVYIKSNTSSDQNVIFYGRGTQSSANVVLATDRWIRYDFTGTATTNFFSYLGVRTDYGSDSTCDILVWGWQIVKGDQPKDYLKTTDRLDIPRIDYTNGEPSILLEPSRTNSFDYSQDFSDTYWDKVGVTIGSNVTTSPEGITNASKIKETSGGTYHNINWDGNVTSGTTYTVSVFLKASERTTASIYENVGIGGGTYPLSTFNLVTGKVDAENTNHTANIENYGNGWFRCSITFTPNASRSGSIYIAPNNTLTYTGVTDSGVFIYGAQLEAGSYATSLIHTSGSAVTRSADAANNAGNSDLINSTEGVLYVEFKTPEPQPTAQYIAINDGAAGTNQVRIGWLNFKIYIQIRAGGSAFYTLNPSTPTHTEFNKIAVKFKASDHAVYINGQEVGTSTASNIFSSDVLNTLSFSAYTTTGKFYGNVKSVMVFKEALTDLELEKLTGYNNHELYMNYYNRLSYLGLVEEYNVESDINNYIL